jgi:putative ABC transport system permease protein
MVESTRFVPVRLSHGHRSERVDLRGYDGRAVLYRVVSGERVPLELEGRGLVLTERLSTKLGVAPGDPVLVDVLEGRPRRIPVVVGATVDESMGLNAYADRRALNAWLGEGDLSNGFVVRVAHRDEASLMRSTLDLPRVAGAFSKATMLRNMEAISARNVRIMSTLLTALAAVIAVGVVYNSARIALAERSWELASLRVLGFTRAEVSALLLGELALVVAVALPLGMALGRILSLGLARVMTTDQFRLPAVIEPRTYAWAAICVLVAGIASALVVRRRIDRLDMVAVLKTRE